MNKFGMIMNEKLNELEKLTHKVVAYQNAGVTMPMQAISQDFQLNDIKDLRKKLLEDKLTKIDQEHVDSCLDIIKLEIEALEEIERIRDEFEDAYLALDPIVTDDIRLAIFSDNGIEIVKDEKFMFCKMANKWYSDFEDGKLSIDRMVKLTNRMREFKEEMRINNSKSFWSFCGSNRFYK